MFILNGKNYIITVSVFICFYACQKDPTGPDENDTEPEMVLIDKDLTYTSGPSWNPTIYDSLPKITLTPYYISIYELTNLQYYQFVEGSGYLDSTYWSESGWTTRNDSNWTGPLYWDDSDPPWANDPYSNQKNTPVHGISFYEAEAYCAWLSDKTGLNYHIPSSNQWIRAAKGPDPGTRYPWGNDFNEANAHYPLFDIPLMPVTEYPCGKSEDGCYNMIGNAYEICVRIPVSDEYKDYALIYSYYSFQCSDPICMKESMTTNSSLLRENKIRKYAVGARICRDQ